MDKMLGGYQALQIRLLDGRLFQKLLSKEPDAQYRSCLLYTSDAADEL